MSRAPENGVYHQMIQRCYNPKQAAYPYYGGRGITVSSEWLASYKTFFADMGPRPGKGYTIDRRDNEGPYCKDNCFWNTMKQQSRNRRSTIVVEYEGRKRKLCELVDESGLQWHTVYARIFTRGWPLDKALRTAAVQTRDYKATLAPT